MKLRLLFTLGLVCCMATIATSNECLRNTRHAAECKAASGGNAATGATGSEASEKADADSKLTGEYSTLLVNKLLYI